MGIVLWRYLSLNNGISCFSNISLYFTISFFLSNLCPIAKTQKHKINSKNNIIIFTKFLKKYIYIHYSINHKKSFECAIKKATFTHVKWKLYFLLNFRTLFQFFVLLYEYRPFLFLLTNPSFWEEFEKNWNGIWVIGKSYNPLFFLYSIYIKTFYATS